MVAYNEYIRIKILYHHRHQTFMVCAVIAKEGRDVVTVDLPGFFLQREQDGEEEILLKLTGAVALLLVESDEEKWKKHVVQENGKCTIYVLYNKVTRDEINPISH